MLSFLSKLAALAVAVQALSLSYRWRASEPKTCFYVPVENTAAMIQIYYSVADKSNDNAKGVVSMTVTGPYNQQLQNIPNQSHAEISVKPLAIGEHSICFSHVGGPSDKTVDLDITFANADGTPYTPPKTVQVDAEGKALPGTDDVTQQLESAINRVNKDLTEISHTMKYLKSREKRNLYTVESNGKMIFWFSLFETVLIMGMSLCQVAILRHFFGRSGRPRV